MLFWQTAIIDPFDPVEFSMEPRYDLGVDRLSQAAAQRRHLHHLRREGELKSLLRYHVVKGKELKPDDVLGKQTKVGTVEGDSLSVDGTGRMVMLVPSGLTVTRVGVRRP
jgi:Fasciclin domain